MTFGNDACISNKKFRPRYAMAQGELTTVMKVKASVLLEIIKNVTNNPVNIGK
jgi:predicted transcriptional regulator